MHLASQCFSTVSNLAITYRYRKWGWEIFEAFEKFTEVDSRGYSSLDDGTTLPPQRRDKM